MDLCSINEINELLNRHGFKFSKALGQNFLIQGWVPERIAESAEIDSNCGVLEIGPGVGCLTRELAKRAEKVVSVELDDRLIPVLSETVGDYSNVKIINGDIMKTDLNALVTENFSGLVPKVCANLPYNITSPVLTKLIESKLFDSITVMVQKEVVNRICAKPNSSEYRAFSVFTQFFTNPKPLFDVPPTCFEPQPKVTSSVITLETRKSPLYSVDESLFLDIVNAAFNQRRKTLPNALQGRFSSVLTKDELGKCIELSGIDIKTRGEAIGIPEFALLTKNIGGMINDHRS